jgi:hypothetical protein
MPAGSPSTGSGLSAGSGQLFQLGNKESVVRGQRRIAHSAKRMTELQRYAMRLALCGERSEKVPDISEGVDRR